jgi:LmbE family N-acetylglucosaminyl deacetylase
MKKRILIIVAHPDDEVLGVGGTAAKHVDAGDEVYCLILGEGAISRQGALKQEITELRHEAQAAAKSLGFKEIVFFSFPDNSFDSIPLLKIIKEVEKYLAKINPHIVYTHYENDLNIDHRLTFQAVITACRPCNDFCPEEVYSFEVLSSTEWQSKLRKHFNPNFYVDIKNSLKRKIEALKKYKSEIRRYPHSRSPRGVEALAHYRGLEAGLESAEAFYLVKKIKK